MLIGQGDYDAASPCSHVDIPQTVLEPILINHATNHGFSCPGAQSSARSKTILRNIHIEFDQSICSDAMVQGVKSFASYKFHLLGNQVKGLL